MRRLVRVWDLPTRLFHWLLAVLMVVSFVTIKVGGNWTRWHFYSGYAILALIVFRVIWGFAGGRYARFTSFLFSPGQIIAYLKGAPNAVRTLGHNPMGSLSVFALIFFVALQAITGLFSNDDIAEEGPLVKFISNATSGLLTSVHHFNEKILIFLVVTHIGAVLFYLLRKRENLIRPMITGDKESDDAEAASPDGIGLRVRGVVILAIAVAVVATVVNWPLKS